MLKALSPPAGDGDPGIADAARRLNACGIESRPCSTSRPRSSSTSRRAPPAPPRSTSARSTVAPSHRASPAPTPSASSAATPPRPARAPANEAGGARGVVYASREVHMSIPKAVALLGLGRANLRLVETDERQRLRVDALERAMADDVAAGRVPVAVVACAGTVSTGAVDPLEAVADVAARHGAWLHVDGAYGALAALAAPAKLAGLARADSLSLDPHKWLYQAVDCGCLLYRDRSAARRAFSHTGAYAASLTDDPVEGFAFFDESLELSRRFRALRLWTSIRYHGLAAFREAIAQDLGHAQRLARLVEADPRLELLAPVELSAVCFRRRFGADADARNAAILAAVNRRGRVYLSNAVVNGAFALRACFTNHRTTEADVDAVVEEVTAAGPA
ncbi:MAG: aminotransferase class V-fold PLP-dependent enzyme [Anaeromyxobacteraceae bacterium]